MSSKSIQSIRGMNDILPDEAPLWESFEDMVREWLRAYGYRNIRTPVLEQTDLFVRSIGEATDIVEKEMYTFTDRLNGESFTLRPEGTAACVRAVIEHNMLYEGPQRLWYWGPMFRHERPQKGRYRQFHQVGVEAIGYPGPDIEAEHLVMCSRLWRQLKLEGVTLDMNNLGDAAARGRYRSRLVKYLERHESSLDADSKRRLKSNPLRVLDSKNPVMRDIVGQAPQLTDDLDDASRRGFDELQKMLRAAKVPFRVNPRLVRGLDYYNGAVYEWVSAGLGAQNAICAGGRYDGLVEQIGGKPAPACGFAMGVERLLELKKQAGSTGSRAVDAYFVSQGQEGTRQFAFQAAEQLRDAGITVTFDVSGGSFKSQMKKADASGAGFAIIVGDDESSAREVTVKALREGGEQKRVPLDQAKELIKKK